MAGPDNDVPSKLYIVNGDRDSPSRPGVVHINHPSDAKLSTYDEVTAFITDHGLKLGDVVRFGQYRDTDTFIVGSVSVGGHLHLVRNPDDSGAGYLTIPAEVLRDIRNGPRKYADIIRADMPTINLHLSSSDAFIAEKLGGRPPEGIQFDVLYVGGVMESISVKLPDTDRWREFDPDDISLGRLTRLLQEQNQAHEESGNATLMIRVELRGEQFTRYKELHSRAARKHAWVQAVPELPESWCIERGVSMTGSTSAAWIWKLQGPARELAEVRRIVGEFLQGFNFEYVDYDTLDP